MCLEIMEVAQVSLASESPPLTKVCEKQIQY